MRADRLVSLLLLLQTRGRMTARLLAIDLWRLETGQTNAAKLGFTRDFRHLAPTPESS